ncbi:MAG TPA: glycosyltransferase family 2 protein, partial [Puia sp.]|nr:glycosyltransferase family 2 protein [Puia sp.]
TDAKFIAAPVKIDCGKGVLDIFQTLDFISLQGITAASVAGRFHSMCNGANLAYEKKAFAEVGGFRGIDQIPSGDDLLLMHKIYLKYPEHVKYLKNENAIVVTDPQITWREFLNQRVRWASKADSYDDKRIFYVLVLVFCFNLAFLALAVAGFFDSRYWLFALALLAAKSIIEIPFISTCARFYGQGELMKYFVLLEPVHIIYVIVTGFWGRFGSYYWKGRKIGRGSAGSEAQVS